MSGTLDIAGLMKWGVSKGLGLIEGKTGLDLQHAAEPIANFGMKHLAFEEIVELGVPLTIVLGVIGAKFKKDQERLQNGNASVL